MNKTEVPVNAVLGISQFLYCTRFFSSVFVAPSMKLCHGYHAIFLYIANTRLRAAVCHEHRYLAILYGIKNRGLINRVFLYRCGQPAASVRARQMKTGRWIDRDGQRIEAC